MMTGFDTSDWNYNDNSDHLLYIMADDSIDLIKDEFNIMTDRLYFFRRLSFPPSVSKG